MPGSHAKQFRLAPEPLTAWPGVHWHVSLPGLLVLPVGHGVQPAAPAKLNVLAGHTGRSRHARSRRCAV